MFLLVSVLLFPLLLKTCLFFFSPDYLLDYFFHINHFNYSKEQVKVKSNKNTGIFLKIIVYTLCQFLVEIYCLLNCISCTLTCSE